MKVIYNHVSINNNKNMITEREKRALQLAKRAYGHFTQDALNIAREIIALERELDTDVSDAVVIPLTQPVSNSVKPVNGFPGNKSDDPKPVIDPKTLRIMQPPYPSTMATDEQALEPEFEERPY